jgi:hypothetical protein
LTDEDRRTLVRWIDLGCPIDLDPQYDPAHPQPRSYGWMGDDQRPTLTVTQPQPGANPSLTRLLVGMADAYTGLDVESFTVTADFDVDGVAAGVNLAEKFTILPGSRWELKLNEPLDADEKTLTVSIADRQGNVNRIERNFTVIIDRR